jgi:hypothetical protein
MWERQPAFILTHPPTRLASGYGAAGQSRLSTPTQYTCTLPCECDETLDLLGSDPQTVTYWLLETRKDKTRLVTKC